MAPEIVYFSYSLDPSVDVPGQEDIFALDPESGALRRLTDDSSGLDFVSDRDPAWSPDRSVVAIHRVVSTEIPHVVLLDAASGETVRQVGPGACPICGMALEPAVITAETPPNPELADFTRRFWIGLALTIPVLASHGYNY